ncbi:MAG: hypothetical protein V3V05_11730 [Pontiella sp.]
MIIGIGMLPLCWGISIAIYKLYQTSVESAVSSGSEAWSLPIGFLLWVLIYFILPRPMRTYVLGHELTHALWALMMGGRIGKIRVGKTGGHVELSKTNFAITLAPYFFPFYTFLVIAIYYLTSFTFDVEPYRIWWLGAIGFTWSFHITFTIHMLSEHQPDIHEHGRIFSYAVIYIMNLLGIGIWMVIVGSPEWTSLRDLLRLEVTIAYNIAYQYLALGWIAMTTLLTTWFTSK